MTLTIDQSGLERASYPHLIKAEDRLSRFLDTVGNGTGTTSAIGDYSTPTSFFITPPTGEIYVLERFLVQIRDALALSADDYGNLTALTNGIVVKVTDASGDVVELTDGMPIKSNADWAMHCYDSDPDNYGNGDNFIHVRWTFSKAGYPISLTEGQSLVALMQDNLTGLVQHTFKVEGYRIVL